MRWLPLFLILLLIGSNALSQESGHDKSVTQKDQKAEQKRTTTKNGPVPIKKLKAQPIENTRQNPDAHSDEKLKIDRQLAEYTGQLSTFTLWLVIATAILGFIGIWQGFQLKPTVDVATFESQPVLSPWIIQMIGLHQLTAVSEPITWDASVHFIFENFGKTPGMIREVRADLFLTERDEFPVVDFGTLPHHNHELMVPGNMRWKDHVGAAVDLKKRITLTPDEFGELLVEGVGNAS